ncbi:lactoylglutathione lyase or related lyase [Corynebacterium deserti GIMN1.010]|uniref:Lactoylglutathione lyase or related lyase n=1 Tax=Corynebacterium deserti GIMN1.010 TaxID=931089 RepID=A0A0M4CGG7_9CORY|nr:VOC family protein [Corynebacterium deserti]ALC04621.1 lactoylglutathione lyase or related lyase [Corynebacterium deserti GIMN1.010]
MRIEITSVFVDDQTKALDFYTNKLGFELKHDVSAGDYRWLTVVDPQNPDGIQLLLEPNQHPAATSFQAAIKKDNIPATQFYVDDVQAEYDRLVAEGVEFVMGPTNVGPSDIAIFDDTVGNLIQIVHLKN